LPLVVDSQTAEDFESVEGILADSPGLLRVAVWPEDLPALGRVVFANVQPVSPGEFAQQIQRNILPTGRVGGKTSRHRGLCCCTVTDAQADRRGAEEVPVEFGGSCGGRRILAGREPTGSNVVPHLSHLGSKPVRVSSVELPPMVASGAHRTANGLQAVDQ